MDRTDEILMYNRDMENSSDMFKLKLVDFGKGLVTAVLSGAALAIIAVLGNVFGASFDAFSLDWVRVGKDVVNALIMGAQAGFLGYISKNFLTSSQGNILGVGDK